jgi:hypothetical protein
VQSEQNTKLYRSELLCRTFKDYPQLMASHGIIFEPFLVTVLADRAELAVARCAECGLLCAVNRLDCCGEFCTECAAPKKS